MTRATVGCDVQTRHPLELDRFERSQQNERTPRDGEQQSGNSRARLGGADAGLLLASSFPHRSGECPSKSSHGQPMSVCIVMKENAAQVLEDERLSELVFGPANGEILDDRHAARCVAAIPSISARCLV